MLRKWKVFLLTLDIFLFISLVWAIGYFRSSISLPMILETRGIWFITFSVLLFYYIFGAFDFRKESSWQTKFFDLFFTFFFSVFLIAGISYIYGSERSGIFGRGIFLGSLVGFICISQIYRLCFLRYIFTIKEKNKILFVGSKKQSKRICEDSQLGSLPYAVEYFIEPSQFMSNEVKTANDSTKDETEKLKRDEEQSILALKNLLLQKWRKVVVGVDDSTSDELIRTLVNDRLRSDRIVDIIRFYEDEWQKIPLEILRSQWFLREEGFRLSASPFQQRVKRAFDLIISSFLTLMLWPLAIIISIVIYLDNPGPVFFTQRRMGREGKLFNIIKFRTMYLHAEMNGPQWAQKNDVRITRMGGFLRKSRMDEIPQLINIIIGDMSFIGPRPERPEFHELLEKEIPFYNLRYMVQPGLSGWAQVKAAYGASISDAKDKLEFDLYYIKKYSLWLDLIIILKTVRVVFRGEGR